MNIKKSILLVSLLAIASLFFVLGRKSADYSVIKKSETITKTINNQSGVAITSTTKVEDSNIENTSETISTSDVPDYAIETLKYIRQNNQAPSGYVGGRIFQNRENLLPKEENGEKIEYQEWDVHPKENGQNRGTERLITSKTKAYYTNNHYKSFVTVTE